MRREHFLAVCTLFLYAGTLISKHWLSPQEIPLILLFSIISFSVSLLALGSRHLLIQKIGKVGFLLIFLTIGATNYQYKGFEKLFPNDNNTSPLKERIEEERENFSNYLDSLYHPYTGEQSIAIVKALSFDYKNELHSHTWEIFKKSGALHLLALSGMHLGIIYGILRTLLSIFGNYLYFRKFRSLIIIVTIWGYTIFTGGAISLLRASVMTSIYEGAMIFSRERNGLNALSISAIIIILVWPAESCNAGFQLSYGAMSGIFLVFPVVRTIVNPKWKLLKYLWESISFSLSCSLFTTPILLLHFGDIAHFWLLTNLLCSPLTTLAMVLIPTSIVADLLLPFTTDFINFLLFKTIEMLIFINEIISLI